jgi:hypothetical protein
LREVPSMSVSVSASAGTLPSEAVNGFQFSVFSSRSISLDAARSDEC